MIEERAVTGDDIPVPEPPAGEPDVGGELVVISAGEVATVSGLGPLRTLAPSPVSGPVPD